MNRYLPYALVGLLGCVAVACKQPAPPPNAADVKNDCQAAFSKQTAIEQQTTPVRWVLEYGSPGNDDGRHVTLTWARCHPPAPGNVLVFRRVAWPGESEQASRMGFVGAKDGTPALSAAFLQGGMPSTESATPPPPPPIGQAGVDQPAAAAPAEMPAAGSDLLLLNPDEALAEGARYGAWTLVTIADATGQFETTTIVDELSPEHRYVYALVPVEPGPVKGTYIKFPEFSVQTATIHPTPTMFHTGRWFFLVLVLLVAGAFFVFVSIARKRGDALFVRRIPAVDAIEDAVGRSTEMGRPVLYVTGLEEIQDIQTIASLLILGHVSEMTATYDTEIKVGNTYPLTMVVAEEIVRQGYANASRLDAHRPENVFFVTSEQFAFAAALNGMILRDKPATNIYFGKFYAESLLLAETGFITGAIQIAGTAEFTQLPFFIAACDYTLIGEELYATSAYLSREPTLLAQLKAGDVVKAVAFVLIVASAGMATCHAINESKKPPAARSYDTPSANFSKWLMPN